MSEEWQLLGTTKDRQGITSDWDRVDQVLIEDVAVREVKNVPSRNGYLTEIFRSDWALDDLPVDQVFQSILDVGGLSAWHAHAHTTDRLFANSGLIQIVLYDPRPESATCGMINEFRFGAMRPALVCVPPRVWHGVRNLSSAPSLLLNLVDRAYRYSDPDHYRLPKDTREIPYAWG